jgi:hypothetical protein
MSGESSAVLWLQYGRHECLNRHTDSFLGRVTKYFLRRRVPQYDLSARGIGDDHRVAYVLEQATYPQVAGRKQSQVRRLDHWRPPKPVPV